MTDPLRREAEALSYQIGNQDANWDCCLTAKGTIDLIIAFAKAQRAAEAREVSIEFGDPKYKIGGPHSLRLFEHWLDQRAKEWEA